MLDIIVLGDSSAMNTLSHSSEGGVSGDQYYYYDDSYSISGSRSTHGSSHEHKPKPKPKPFLPAEARMGEGGPIFAFRSPIYRSTVYI